MVPIFEQGKGQGIGYSYPHFLKRLIDICESHLSDGRAKGFALILYDFHDTVIRDILKSQGGFAKLDRLSGENLSIFYLHSNTSRRIEDFNKILLGAFGVAPKITPPLIIFFKMKSQEPTDVQIVQLYEDNKIFAFQELYDAVTENVSELDAENANKTGKRRLPLLGGPVVKVVLEKSVEYILSQLSTLFIQVSKSGF
ncbi:hypothetical protein [Dyadobacter sp. SG02]|uniref:hypothetical protein n=1 Tax=Dyadobacter sp. SG02 TaxID=1855291 RepID=UPI000B850822|nr:hypothetical protein [Dyadobacter sp. SG02]